LAKVPVRFVYLKVFSVVNTGDTKQLSAIEARLLYYGEIDLSPVFNLLGIAITGDRLKI